MKKNNSKKVFSAFAVLAISAATVATAIPFAACDKNNANPYSESANTVTIDTALGATRTQTGTKKYVTPTGAGTKDGSSWENAATINLIASADEASANIQAGDTVYFEPGVYSGMATRLGVFASGRFNSYIRIVNAALEKDESGYQGTGTTVTLDFSAMTFDGNNRGVQLYGNYIYWYGIDVCGAGDNGLYIGGSYNTVEYCEFYNNRDTGLQLGRSFSEYTSINQWPSYNLVKNCTSHNNYDNDTYGENADGFAAKLTVGYGNVFDGCIAYRNSDDGWDLYAKTDSGNIGAVIIYNCVAYENGYLEYTQKENNARFPTWNGDKSEDKEDKLGKNSYKTRDGDGNGFKLGGSVMEGDVMLYNCLSFGNRMHGVTDNSNPGFLKVDRVTSYDNSAAIDDDPSSQYFGKVVDIKNHDTHNNIDVARQTYSYNSVSRTLSAGHFAQSLGKDEYKGAVTDSFLLSAVKTGTTTANMIKGSIDANTKTGLDDKVIGPVNSGSTKTYKAAEIFAKLPVLKTVTGEGGEAVTAYMYNIDGSRDLYETGTSGALKAARAHITYRNSDGSVNMGDILALDATKLPDLKDKNLGSVLNLTTWDGYTHYFKDDVLNGTLAENKAKMERIKEALTLSVSDEAVYQNFDVPSKMLDCTIEWSAKSGSENNLEVLKGENGLPVVSTSVSQSEYHTIKVTRPTSGSDIQVTLVATLTVGSDSNKVVETKEFTLTLKVGSPTIGNVLVTANLGGYEQQFIGTPVKVSGEKNLADAKTAIDAFDAIEAKGTYSFGSFVMDQYTVAQKPEIKVQNGMYDDPRYMSEDDYDYGTLYLYQETATSNPIEVKAFTPSKAGVYTVIEQLNVKNSEELYMVVYKIFVASATAQVDFTSDPTVAVNRDGFMLTGVPNSATGSLYVLASNTAITDISSDNITSKAGVKVHPFRDTSLNVQFTNSNSSEYYIYSALANAKGDVTSKIYTTKINVVNISTAADFMKIAGGEKLGEEDTACTIYMLTSDIDFTGVEYKISSSSFKGLLNGMGHTISNITVNGKGNTGVFYKLDGGTIENVKFNNIKINGGDGQKTALVSETSGGYFYNIAITDINVVANNERVAGLVAVVNVGAPLHIDNVSIINSAEYKIDGAGKGRTGGLIGFSQANSGAASGKIEIYVANCYVDTEILAAYEVGGIMGTYDCGNNPNVNYNLEIESCVFAGTIRVKDASKTYAGGILGYQKGAYTQMTISKCVSIGKIFHIKGTTELVASLKNASGIVGCFTNTLADGVTAKVTQCLAFMEEYNNAEFDVTAVSAIEYRFTLETRLSEEYWTFIVKDGEYEDPMFEELEAPYVTLNFLNY